MGVTDQEKHQRPFSMLSGALITAAAFSLVLSFVAWFMPKFLVFADSRWSKLLPLVAFFFIMLSARRLRRAKFKRHI
ncbi:MAG TPA: hypothetical protein VF532_22435 [Candidatus Angelobacter sp.]